jgi:phosphoribosylanthranilate isomerase
MRRRNPAEPLPMFRIKICGITNLEDAAIAVDAGADAIGLNFYEKSPRYVQWQDAMSIILGLGRRPVQRIGVFVNSTPTALPGLTLNSILSGVQFHGDESPAFVAKFIKSARPYSHSRVSDRPFLIRARRMDDEGVAAIAKDLTACCEAGGAPNAVLVDALSPGRYGGTGETVSWLGLADHKRWLGDTPLILAGGLTPDNVAEAIRIVRPAAVDVASGVESAPGKKDPLKVRDFIQAARAAFGD